jgi:hypothetical protein
MRNYLSPAKRKRKANQFLKKNGAKKVSPRPTQISMIHLKFTLLPMFNLLSKR